MDTTAILDGPGPIRTVEHPLLDVAGVSVRFGGLSALSDVTFTLTHGHSGVIGLIGPNGAGKSTLFNVISGLSSASSGTVRLDGRDVSHLRGDRIMRRGVTRTFQGVALASGLNVAENARLGLHTRRTRRGGQLVDQTLERLGLGGYQRRPVDGLTYGERKRVELARAVLTGPRLLLLDEPFAGLSAAESEMLYRLIGEVSSDGVQVVLVEHDMGLVMKLCTRILVLSSGFLIAEGTPAEVRRDPAVIEAYLGAE